jgi:hypothetical protein
MRRHAGQAARAEAIARDAPDVETVIPALSSPGEKPRYPIAGPRVTTGPR